MGDTFPVDDRPFFSPLFLKKTGLFLKKLGVWHPVPGMPYLGVQHPWLRQPILWPYLLGKTEKGWLEANLFLDFKYKGGFTPKTFQELLFWSSVQFHLLTCPNVRSIIVDILDFVTCGVESLRGYCTDIPADQGS